MSEQRSLCGRTPALDQRHDELTISSAHPESDASDSPPDTSLLIHQQQQQRAATAQHKHESTSRSSPHLEAPTRNKILTAQPIRRKGSKERKRGLLDSSLQPSASLQLRIQTRLLTATALGRNPEDGRNAERWTREVACGKPACMNTSRLLHSGRSLFPYSHLKRPYAAAGGPVR